MCRQMIAGPFLLNISCGNFVLGDGKVEPKSRRGSILNYISSKRKSSVPEKLQDYSSVEGEVCLLEWTIYKNRQCIMRLC